jgi:hypothetical protein
VILAVFWLVTILDGSYGRTVLNGSPPDSVHASYFQTQPSPIVYRKRHISKGDYQQTSGKRSEKRIPTGKLFGMRKFDLVATPKGIGFVKGKRSSGYFAIATLDGTPIHNSARAMSCSRLAARSTTLIRSARFLPTAEARGIHRAEFR